MDRNHGARRHSIHLSENALKVLPGNWTLHNIDAYALRGRSFYEGIVNYRKTLMPKHGHRIKRPEDFACFLCGGKTGTPLLIWEERYLLFECRDCSAISPNITFGAELKHEESLYCSEEYYQKTRKEILAQYQYRKDRFGQERAQFVLDRVPRNADKPRILDVGCGAGYFLSVLKDRGIEGRGLEVATPLVRYCRETGLDVSDQPIESEPDGHYDAITLFDVLEHLTAPIETFRAIHAKLRPGGICIAYSPNIRSVGYELMGSRQNTLLPFEHVCFYGQRSLEYLAGKTDFTIENVYTFGLDIVDYLLMKEYEDRQVYFEHLKELAWLMQSVLDRDGLSNHFRIVLRKA